MAPQRRTYATLIPSFLAGACILITSCRTSDGPIVNDYLWRSPGLQVPSTREVEAYAREPAGAKVEIREGLRSRNVYVRRRAAFLVEVLGSSVVDVSDLLLGAYRWETDLVNKAFMTRAFAELDPAKSKIIKSLRASFYRNKNKVLRSYIAGAIIKLDPQSENIVELQYIVDSLDPTMSLSDTVNDATRMQFWERRWAAAYMIAKLDRRASQLVEPLERMSQSDGIPEWVREQAQSTVTKIFQ